MMVTMSVSDLPLPSPGECLALLVPERVERAALLGTLCKEHSALLVSSMDALFSRLDVAGNVSFPLRGLGFGRRERERLTAELLAMAGLDGVARDGVHRLDGAMRARTILTRAYASGRILVLDDPFASVAWTERPALHHLLRLLTRQRRASVVLATDDPAELLACGDRICVVESGRVLRVGAVSEMLADPGSAFAARALLHAVLFAGQVSADVDDRTEAAISLACGATMQSQLSEAVGAGNLCLVAIRPDRVAFAAVRTADLGVEGVGATLLDIAHHSDHVRLRLRLSDGSQLVIRRPAASLTPRDIARASEPMGASLSWRPSDAMAYPHPQA